MQCGCGWRICESIPLSWSKSKYMTVFGAKPAQICSLKGAHLQFRTRPLEVQIQSRDPFQYSNRLPACDFFSIGICFESRLQMPHSLWIPRRRRLGVWPACPQFTRENRASIKAQASLRTPKASPHRYFRVAVRDASVVSLMEKTCAILCPRV